MHWEQARHKGYRDGSCRVQRDHALVTESSADLPLLPSVPTNSKTASACSWHRNHKHFHTAGVRPASQPCRFPHWQTVCKNKATNGQTFASPICASAFQDRWNGWRTLILQEKKMPWTMNFAFEPASPSAAAQIPEDRGLLFCLFILFHQLHPHHSSKNL